MSGAESEEHSPDGRTLVRWAVSDGRMSHIIRTPEIVDAASGALILRCADSGFDAEIAWRDEGRFEIDLRHYWRQGTLRIAVDREAATFHESGGSETGAGPLSGLSDFIEAHFMAAEREAQRNLPSPQEQQARAMRRNELMLGLIAAAICVAIWVLFFRR